MSSECDTKETDKKKAERIFYNLLMKGDKVSMRDVLNVLEDTPLKDGVPNKVSDYYDTVRSVVSDMIKELKALHYNIEKSREKHEIYYQYTDSDPDPLVNIHKKEEYETKRKQIQSEIDSNKPIEMDYCPFQSSKYHLVFHPHRIVNYNGRLFAIGVSVRDGKELMRRSVIGIDRIVGDITRSKGKLIRKESDEYEYLKHLVGVTMEKGAMLQTITLRAKDKYTFGRLVFKPLHFSQRVIKEWTDSDQEEGGYGEVSIEVYPNKELVGQILSYGSYLEVVSPPDFRKRVAEEFRKAGIQYQDV